MLVLVICLVAKMGQGQTVEEDLQEVLEALATADQPYPDLGPEGAEKIKSSTEGSWHGLWDCQVRIGAEGEVARSAKWKLQDSWFEFKGKVWQPLAGAQSVALTGRFRWGKLDLYWGNIGLISGYGLLIQGPGRTGGLAANQAFRSHSNRIKSWAAKPDQRAYQGLGSTWKGETWCLTVFSGQGRVKEVTGKIGSLFLEKTFSTLNVTLGWVDQWIHKGATISASWDKGPHQMGFEVMGWKSPGFPGYHGDWLVSWRTRFSKATELTAQWVASNSNLGPKSGARSPILGAWGGAGWAFRLVRKLVPGWRLKSLWSENQGVDWQGPHRKQKGMFVDLLLEGTPHPGWNFLARWHQRTRSRQAWSEFYPWLPPALVARDERSGFSLRLKVKGDSSSWSYSLRNLQRKGTASPGSRFLAALGNRRRLSRILGMKLSFQTAWGDPIDLVGAVNPLQGLVLPRHWGHWSTEMLLGLDIRVKDILLQGSASRREPTPGDGNPAEYLFWLGARARW